MKRSSVIRNQHGQAFVEYVLMLVVVLTLSFMVKKYLKTSGYLKNVVFSPWAKLNGMVQCGVWAPCGVEVAAPGLHANTAGRVLSLDPRYSP